ncbi:unnamed protein product [Scytosiphon promiscuus]
MVAAERTGAAISADQACLRFEHPCMVRELAEMEQQPLEGGRPGVTRVVALGPADFLCGLSKGGVLRIRPGLARPCLLAQATSVLGLGFSTIKRMGVRRRKMTLSPASIPSRVVRLTTEGLEVWSVVRQPLVGQVQRALGVSKACLLDIAVTGAPTNISPSGGGGEGSPVVNWGLELLVLAVAASGALSIHAVRVSSEEASWVGSSVSVKVRGWGGSILGAGWRRRRLRWPRLSYLAAAALAFSPPSSRLRATLVADKERAFCQWGGNAESFPLGGGTGSGGGVTAHVFWASMPAPTSSSLSHAILSALPSRVAVSVLPSLLGGHAFTPSRSGPYSIELDSPSPMTLAEGQLAALAGGCIGGGGALLGCPGVVLLSDRGQAVWVAPRSGGSTKGVGSGCRRRLRPACKLTTNVPADSHPGKGRSTLQEGLNAFEAGKAMDSARLAVESLLSRGFEGVEESPAGASKDLDAAIVRVRIGQRSGSRLGRGGNCLAGLEVLNGSWRHPSAFTSPHQLVHLALREKARRHRALLRFLLDAGAEDRRGFEAVRAAGEACRRKVARLLSSPRVSSQDAISRKSVGAKAARLLDECIALALQRRREEQEEAGGGLNTAGAAGDEVKSERDRYFEHTDGVLDALVELHTPRLDDAAPSSSIDGATLTPLSRGLRDRSLSPADGVQLLDHLSVVVAGVLEAALRHRASERSVYRTGVRARVWTASGEARRVLYRQLLAYTTEIAVPSAGVSPRQGAASGRNAGGGSSIGSSISSEGSRGVIGRLSVLLLDGFKEEEEVNPAASGKVEWQGEYLEAKALCVTVVAACGREDLARSLAAKHGYLEGTVSLCHQAEMRKPGCQNGHNLLRQRMAPPAPPRGIGGQGQGEGGPGGEGNAFGAESESARLERENFARFVLDWHLRRGLKTALLDVGAAVPNILCEFLADWREAELLWMFQIRLQDYTGAGRALTRGTPPPNQRGGKCEAQHLWLSLAKLAFLAGGGSAAGGGPGGDGASADPARGAEIQRRLELAEVRDRLVKSLPEEEVAANAHLMNQPWAWVDALEEATRLLNSFSQEGMSSEGGQGATGYDVEEAADIAFQGYRALVAGLPEGSPERAYCLWREVVGLTLADKGVREAVAKGAMPSASGDRTAATDREMEAVWKRPTVLHLLLRAIKKDRRLRREAPWASAAASAEEEAEIDLTDECLFSMVHELLPAAADGEGGTCEAWIAAIRKCPW